MTDSLPLHYPVGAAAAPPEAAAAPPEVPTSAEPGRGRLLAWLIFVGLLILLGYTANALVSTDGPADFMFRYSTAIAGVVAYAVLAVPVLVMLRGLPAREVLALRPPTRWRRALGLALAVFVACFVFAAFYGATFDPHDTAAIPSYWDGSRTGAFLANLIVIAVIAPVVEELMFRGLGYRLLERDGTRAAIVVTGVLFGLVHGYVLALPAMVFFGIAIGWLRRKTGSVYPGMLVHGTTNALIVLIAAASA
jgi:CAAX protease family protein